MGFNFCRVKGSYSPPEFIDGKKIDVLRIFHSWTLNISAAPITSMSEMTQKWRSAEDALFV
jgi:hypothetical protein